DSFTYTVTDTQGAVSNTGTVTITVDAPPLAVNDAYTTTRNTAEVVAASGVKGNDTEDAEAGTAVTAARVTGPRHETLAVGLAGDGSFTYTPAADYTGLDSFTYTVADTQGAVSNTATVTLTVVASALHLTKSVDKTTATPGATLTYTLGYSNTGTSSASGVV